MSRHWPCAAWAWALLACGPLAAVAAPARSLCDTGRHQSPVDIAAPRAATLPPLQFAYRPGALHAVNDGHTVRVRIAAGSTLQLGAQRLTLNQFHFHLPGGDRIAGEDFPLALHFLHKSPAGQLVPLVLLFRQGAEHPALAALLPRLPGRGEAPRRETAVPVNPADWLPTQPGYYAYEGSETAPPCTEGVHWLVMKTVQTVSAAQLAQLARLFPPNARPVQPLNGRVVQASP